MVIGVRYARRIGDIGMVPRGVHRSCLAVPHVMQMQHGASRAVTALKFVEGG
jgi:hypothetical protein